MLFSTRRVFGPCVILMILTGCLLTLGPAASASTKAMPPSAPDDFPVYPVIKPNVDFWIDIFSKYCREDGVIHDTRNLSLIYGVVKLNPANTRKAAKQNRDAKKKAIKSYRAILTKLAAGKAPATAKRTTSAKRSTKPKRTTARKNRRRAEPVAKRKQAS